MKEIDRAGKCGLYCGACPFYRATVDPAFKEQWKQEHEKWEDSWYCLGCSNLDERSWGNDCKMVQCNHDHQTDFCHHCGSFPCEKLTAFSTDDYPHHHTCLSGSIRMKELGCEAWIQEQEKRWSCPNCGAPYDWYAKTCHQCGKPVFNCVAEDEQTEK